MSKINYRRLALDMMARQAAARQRAAYVSRMRERRTPPETEDERKRRLRSERARIGWAKRKARSSHAHDASPS